MTRPHQAARDWLKARLEPVGFLGEVILATGQAVRHGWRTRKPDLLRVFSAASSQALGIVMLVNLLVGAILAFVGALQLVKFGAGIFVADLVSIAVTREMAAIITAVVVAGRTAASFAAELATMQVNEEVDALRVLGIDPIGYLVLPRVLALVVVMPMLYVYGCVASLFGGLVVGSTMLDLNALAYFDRVLLSVKFTHVGLGLSKSLVFGALIAVGGCYAGMRASRDAAGVGRATTEAVVTGIVGVFALDAVFAVLANALNI